MRDAGQLDSLAAEKVCDRLVSDASRAACNGWRGVAGERVVFLLQRRLIVSVCRGIASSWNQCGRGRELSSSGSVAKSWVWEISLGIEKLNLQETEKEVFLCFVFFSREKGK